MKSSFVDWDCFIFLNSESRSEAVSELASKFSARCIEVVGQAVENSSLEAGFLLGKQVTITSSKLNQEVSIFIANGWSTEVEQRPHDQVIAGSISCLSIFSVVCPQNQSLIRFQHN